MFSASRVLPRDCLFTFKKKLYSYYVCVFVFVYFPHSSTNGHILYPPAMPCFFTVYAGERFLSIHSEFLCSLIRLHSSLFREAP